jgi:maltose alpha-D-glucosyltransferase/alpha-amylase
LPAAAREAADRLIALQADVQARIDAVMHRPVDAVKTRHHGDYHLGQVLVAENDFVIIDFEGEPARPIAERGRKHSALRDVAGLLRSIDYAAHMSLDRFTQERPQDRSALQSFVRQWRTLTAQTFLEGYKDAIAGSRVYPQDGATGRALIQFFTLEKALYEITYELGSRPAWVTIPLEGLIDLLGDTG